MYFRHAASPSRNLISLVGPLTAFLMFANASCSREEAPPPTSRGLAQPATSSTTLAPGVMPSDLPNIPPPPPEEPPPSARAPSVPCQKLAAVNESLAEQFTSRLGPSSLCTVHKSPSEMACTTLRNGVTWGYRLASASASIPANRPNDATNCIEEWNAELVRQSPGGAYVIVPGGELSSSVEQDEHFGIQLEALSDYDADGEPELLRTVYFKPHESDGSATRTVLTHRAGRVQEYAPLRGRTFEGTQDVDGDGLIDLLTASPYGKVAFEGPVLSIPVAPPLFAYLARKDGSFSAHTQEAKAYTQRFCKNKQVPEFTTRDLGAVEELGPALICARLWGATTEQIETQFKKVCPVTYGRHSPAPTGSKPVENEAVAPHQQRADAEPDAADCQPWILTLARISTPWTFTGAPKKISPPEGGNAPEKLGAQ